MRFGIDCREFQGPGLTGTARELDGLINWTAANRPNIVPVAFLNDKRPWAPDYSRVEKIVIPEGVTLAWDQVHLPKALKRENIDVFLSPYVKVPFNAHCPIIMILHDLIPLEEPEERGSQGLLKTLYYQMLLSKSMRRADHIITVSEYTKREFVRVMGADENKITVVHDGLDERLSPVTDEVIIAEARSRNGIDGKYIFYLGHLRASKNVGSLIRAYALLPGELREEYALAIGGRKTGEYAALEKLAGELGLGDRVLFLGYVSEEDVAPLTSGAAVFAYPSKYEGFGYPPLEAMARGAPVVCSTATSLAEVTGDAAIGVEPEPEPIAAAIRKVLSEPGLRAELIKKGAEQVKKFTVADMARRYVEIAESLVAR